MSESDGVSRLADFEPFIGEGFAIHTPEGMDVPAELVEAKLIRSDSLPDAPREPFCLLFKLETGFELIQHHYEVAHPKAGGHPMFLVPVGLAEGRLLMEAIFN